jgi:hypothetical protein
MGVLDSLDALDAPSTAVPADELRQVKTLLWDIVRVNVAPAEVDEVKRFLGTAAVDDNAQLMDEASALATIVGEVRRDVDDGATARRLYENPARALVEGELRLLVKSIRRTASGDSAEGSGRPPSGRPRSLAARRETEEPEREINWADIGGGGVDDPTRVVDPPKPPPRGAGVDSLLGDALGPAMDARTEKLLVATAKERAMLEYVVGGADALSIRAGTPRTPPSRPASRCHSSRPPSSAGSHTSGAGAPESDGSSSVISDPAAAVARVGADRVTIFDVDAVAAPLRELLVEERAALLDDVEYLRRCLEEEAEIGRRVRAPPPDVTELRNYGAKLRGVLESERERAAHVAKVEKMLAAAPSDGVKKLGRVGKLRSLAKTLHADVGGVGGGGDDASARMRDGGDDTSARTRDGVASPEPPAAAPARALVPAPPPAPPPIGARRQPGSGGAPSRPPLGGRRIVVSKT